MATKERWASRVGLVLAMAGNAVGLGNFLRFPVKAVQNGGGAFLIPYLVALLVLGLPLMWIEWTMGRHGGRFGHHSAPGAFDAMGRRPYWKYLGVFGLWVNLIIASYYLYIESWTLAYAGHSVMGGFAKSDPKAYLAWLTGEQPNQIFAFSPWGFSIFLVCMVINIFILSRGLQKGIELVSKVGMPLLILFAAILAVRGLLINPTDAAHASGFGIADAKAVASPWEGLNYVWEPKYDKLSDPAVWLAAAGQIFFTLSIGMGSIHCYASYLRDRDDVTLTGASAAWTNECCEVLLGGTILIPISVAYLGFVAVKEATASGSGFGLGFKVFPTLFQNWGSLAPAAGFLWFGLLFFAAITSSLAMGQPIMSFLQTEFRLRREKSALCFGLMLLPLAVPIACVSQKTFFDEFDYWGGTFALVLFAAIETILFVWVFGMEKGWAEMHLGAELQVPKFFYYVMKYVTPVALLAILATYFLKFETVAEVQADPANNIAAQAATWRFAPDGLIGQVLLLDLPVKSTDPPEVQKFTKEVRFWRLIDRAVLVGTFVFFSVLVYIAWQRRKREGLIPYSEAAT